MAKKRKPKLKALRCPCGLTLLNNRYDDEMMKEIFTQHILINHPDDPELLRLTGRKEQRKTRSIH